MPSERATRAVGTATDFAVHTRWSQPPPTTTGGDIKEAAGVLPNCHAGGNAPIRKSTLQCLALSLAALGATPLVASADRRHVEVSLNNNPRCATRLESSVKREVWDICNCPSVTVTGSGFEDGIWRLALILRDVVTVEEDVKVTGGHFEKVVELSAPLEDPREIEVKVGTEYHQRVAVPLRRLFGRATHFDGRPIAHPIVTTSGGPCAVGDAHGNFEIFLCGPARTLAVWDESYSFSTVETWLTHIDLQRDLEVDVRIGTLELYELGAWSAFSGVYLHFIPMSLSRSLPLVQQGLTEEELIGHPEVWPHLAEQDVRVLVGGDEVPISSFSEFEDFMSERDGKRCIRPGYIVGISKQHWKPGVVKVEVSQRLELDGTEILDQGEAYYLGMMSN